MEILNTIINSNKENINLLISNKIKEKNSIDKPVKQLGFIGNGKSINVHKGFIPLSTRIKYDNLALETYSMNTEDFFYEFAYFIKEYNINSKGSLIYNLEYFINKYFGYYNGNNRTTIFNDNAWNTTTTDEEYFNALENNKIGDLKEKGAALCTERSAIAQQILSLFDIETYYCIGCIDINGKQEPHCFNIVKRSNDYALLDYSIPVIAYNKDSTTRSYYPFVGIITPEEFNNFINTGVLKTFNNYSYSKEGKIEDKNSLRTYIIGDYKIITNKIKK